MSTEEQDNGFLKRWSERKRSGVEEDDEIVLSAEQEAELSEEQEAILLANKEAAEAIDLDTIDEESDLSLFMKEGVPEVLKKAALAKLWRSSPVFANVDGLVDYDDNFADPSLIMKTFTSAYQVGQGYLKELVEGVPDDIDENETALAVAAPQDKIVDEEYEETATIGEDLVEPIEHEPDQLGESVSEDRSEATNIASVSLRERLGLSEVDEV